MTKLTKHKKTDKIKESEVQKAILDWLRWHKIFCWKTNNTGIFKQKTGSYIKVGMKGIADLIGIIPPSGRLLAIEVKRPGNTASSEQKSFLASIRASGGIGFIAFGIEDVERELKQFIQSR